MCWNDQELSDWQLLEASVQIGKRRANFIKSAAIAAESGKIKETGLRQNITVNCEKTTKMSIDQMRRAYLRDGLLEQDMHSDPMVQFRKWFEDAQQPDLPDWMEINAMTLSTADSSGRVTSRIVLLKGIEVDRLYFYTNYESDKAHQIADNPLVSLCFFWPHLERQVRIEGRAEKTDRETSDDYFHRRPRDSQLGAHVSRQSAPVAGREILERRMEELESQYADRDVPCPEHWGGYEVTPSHFEFWQGRPSRLHDRIRFRKGDGGTWQVERLSP